MFRRTPVVATVLALALSLTLSLAVVVPAGATIYVLPNPVGTSSTNPSALGEPASTWREGWGNKRWAQFTLNVPAAEAGEPAIMGAVYALSRPGSSLIDTLSADQWGDCYNTPLVGKSEWPLLIDAVSEFNFPGPLFGPASTPASATLPFEGPYEMAWRYYANGVANAAYGKVRFGLDMTPPRKVENLQVRAGYLESPTSGQLDQSRVHLSWDNVRYDDLAGTGYFEVFVDGMPLPAGSETQRVYDYREHYAGYGIEIPTPRKMTLENLSPGTHAIQIRAVDRAQNPGPLSDPVSITIDYDDPTIDVLAPSSASQHVAPPVAVKANAKDGLGLDRLTISIDSSVVANIVAPSAGTTELAGMAIVPYNGLTEGTHTVTVVAVDGISRTTTATRDFVVDSTVAPTMSDFNPVGPGSDVAWSSSTNSPGSWKDGWGNSLFPQVYFQGQSYSATQNASIYYTVDRSPLTHVNLANKSAYEHSPMTSGSIFDGVIDQTGILAANPALDGRLVFGSKATKPIEGVWYLHAAYDALGAEPSGTKHLAYGIDVTVPDTVTGLAAYPSAASSTAVGSELASTRVNLRWPTREFDKLSGTSFFRIYDNGELLLPSGTAGNATQWYASGESTGSVTIENLGDGQHSIRIAAVDRAGNEGSKSPAVNFRVNDRAPNLAIFSPSNGGQSLAAPVMLQAYAEDDLGLAQISLLVDGIPVHSQAISGLKGYARTILPWGSFLDGEHMLTAIATDDAGKSTPKTILFSIDNDQPLKYLDYDIVDFDAPTGTGPRMWSRTPTPSVETPAPDIFGGMTPNAYYLLDRTPDTVVNLGNKQAYSNYKLNDRAKFATRVDLQAVVAADAGLDAAVTHGPKVSSAVEGIWYLHAAYDVAEMTPSPTYHTPFGIDVTDPAAVTGLAAYMSATATEPVSAPLPATTVHLRWDNDQYDVLSGTSYYVLYDNGVAIRPVDGMPNKADAMTPVYDPHETTATLTLEDLDRGVHRFQVAAVDEAGNMGPRSAAFVVRVDMQDPIADIQSPATDGSASGEPVVVKVIGSDDVELASLRLEVDGDLVSNTVAGSQPATGLVGMAVLPAGTLDDGSHALRVVATDAAGHVLDTTKSFEVVGSADLKMRDFEPASIVETLTYGSQTNPDDSHRTKWGNLLLAQVEFLVPGDPLADGSSLYYRVDRSPLTQVDLGSRDAYSHSTLTNGALYSGLIDQQGIVAADPSLGGQNIFGTRAALPVEGVWYFHGAFDGDAKLAGETYHLAYGLDLTPPRQVTGFNAYANEMTSTVTTGTILSTRVHLRWDNSQYDDLAGTSHYVVYDNGQQVVGNEIGQADNTPYYRAGDTTASITIENLVPGNHSIQVAAVDRAGNVGPRSATLALRVAGGSEDEEEEEVDLPPSVTVLSPSASGARVAPPITVRARATDERLASLAIAVDGIELFRKTSASMDATRLAGMAIVPQPLLASGDHTATVTAVDHVGHVVVEERAFTVDPTLAVSMRDFFVPEPSLLSGTSLTNHYDSSDVTSVYREMWGNSLKVQFTFTEPSFEDAERASFYYTIDRSPLTAVDLADKTPYAHSLSTGGTLFDGEIDHLGVLATNPEFGGSGIFGPKATLPVEGVWYLHSTYEKDGVAVHGTNHTAYGIDVTPPSAVDGIGVFNGPTAAAPAGSLLPSTRAHIRWTSSEYDSLSGTAYYRIYDGDKLLLPQEDGLPGAGKAVPWHKAGETTASVTIENLSVGVHSIRISAVDRAGNEGPLSAPIEFAVDTKDPTIEVLSPETESLELGAPAVVKASASDDHAVAGLTLEIDGVEVAASAAASAEETRLATMALMPSGSLASGDHTLTVIATDRSGHVATTERRFSVSPSAPLRMRDFEPTSVESTLTWSSTTNPDTRWRTKWGNQLLTKVGFEVPDEPVSEGASLYYRVDRAPLTRIDLSDRDAYAHSTLVDGTLYAGLIDQQGIVAADPSLAGSAIFGTRAALPIEGVWYFHGAFAEDETYQGRTFHLAYGLDLTPPARVTNATPFANESTTTAVSGTLPSTRVHLRWANSEYDELAGTSHYVVYDNNEVVVGNQAGDALNTPYYRAGDTTAAVTIENLQPGDHVIEVAAVDRAGNVGPRSAALTLRVAGGTTDPGGGDPGGGEVDLPPVVGVLSPAVAGQRVAPPVAVRAVALDERLASLTMSIDGTEVYSATSPSMDASRLAGIAIVPQALMPSGDHTLTVTAIDHIGHVVTETRAFVVDPAVAPKMRDFTPLDGAVLSGSSETNPNEPTLVNSFYREMWGNSLKPQFTFTEPSFDEVERASFYYTVDRSPTTLVDLADKTPYAHSLSTGGTLFDGEIDQLGILATNPELGGAAVFGPKATLPVEGIWYFHAGYEKDGVSVPGTTHLPYGIDITPPGAVSGLAAYDGPTAPVRSGAVLPSSRVHLRWSNAEYDALSGTAYYRVYDNGSAILPQGGEPAAGAAVPWYQPGETTSTITIENMEVGSHSIRIAAVDRAGNEGPLSAPIDFVVDTSDPTVKFLSPEADNQVLGSPVVVKASAADDHALVSLSLEVDGTEVARASSASGETTSLATMALMPAGSLTPGDHILTVRTADAAGHSVAQQRHFTVSDSATLKMSHFEPVAIGTKLDFSSTTNPPQTSWRTAWGKSALPHLTITAPLYSAADKASAYYVVDRAPLTNVDLAQKDRYSHTSLLDGTTLNNTIDQLGIVSARPELAAAGYFGARATAPIEGVWYLHTAFDAEGQAPTKTYHFAYGVDVSAPQKLDGLTAYNDATASQPATATLLSSRVHLRWPNREYDALSGTAYYRVFDNGQMVLPTSAQLSANAGVPWYRAGESTGSITIENLERGSHRIEVAAVDRAGNMGPLSDAIIVSVGSGGSGGDGGGDPGGGDPDEDTAPSVKILSPSADGVAMAPPVSLRAVAYDDFSIRDIYLDVDGVTLYHGRAASLDETGLAAQAVIPYGSMSAGEHTIVVRATDGVGHVSSDTSTFTVNAALAPRMADYYPPTLIDGLSGSSTTNPNEPNGEKSFWRQMWGTSLYPQFLLREPTFPANAGASLYYTVDRSPLTPIDLAFKDGLAHSSLANGTTFEGQLDQMGILASDPAFAGANLFGPKASQPVEGVWFWHFAYDVPGQVVPGPYHIAYGIDVTAPSRVESVGVFASPNATQPLVGMPPSSRVHLRWKSREYDKLSGTAYYRVYANGECIVPGDTPLDDPVAGEGGVSWYRANESTASLTLENLPQGLVTLTVTAVDRAGNESPVTSGIDVLIDNEAPTLAITAPAAGQRVPASATFKAQLTDAVMSDRLVFYVDDVPVATYDPTTKAKVLAADVTANLSGFDNGQHILRVVGRDLAGHSVSATRYFVLDKTAPTLSSVSGAPNPFFPRKREGYKDNFVVRFGTNEGGTAILTVKDSTGKTWRTVSKSVGTGSQSVIWNGKSNANTMKSGTFKWYLRVKDAAGNYSTTKSGSVTIRYYEIVRTSAGSVRVVQR